MNQRPIDKLKTSRWFRDGWRRAYYDEIYDLYNRHLISLREECIRAKHAMSVRRYNAIVAELDGKPIDGAKDGIACTADGIYAAMKKRAAIDGAKEEKI